MANLPLGFFELAAGAILLTAGLQNKSVAQVVTGQASTAAPLVSAPASPTGPIGAPSSTTPAGSSSAPVGLPQNLNVPGQGAGANAARSALGFLGDPYVLGGLTRLGIDCSGLVKAAYQTVGVDLPHNAAQQWLYVRQHGTVKTLASVVAGDLLFFEPTAEGPGHVAIALGGGQAVEAPHTGDVVKTISIAQLANADGFVGAGSPLPTR